MPLRIMLRLLPPSTKRPSNGHVTFNTIAIIPFSDADTRHTMDMIIRPINDPGVYISSVFLIRKDRELSFAGKLFLEEIGVLK